MKMAITVLFSRLCTLSNPVHTSASDASKEGNRELSDQSKHKKVDTKGNNPSPEGGGGTSK